MLKPKVILLGVVAFLLLFFYPLAKRFTYFPQIFLGLAFNFGLIMANVQVNTHLNSWAWAYYFFAILWTVHYDTLYALVDYKDDLTLGVKSIPTYFKHKVDYFLAVTSLLQILVLFCIWYATGFSLLRTILFLTFILFLLLQYYKLRTHRERIALQLFTQHVFVGALIFIGVL